ncbi:MAG: PaaI family thioesterase [Syntrophorhabdaceae bacterium]
MSSGKCHKIKEKFNSCNVGRLLGIEVDSVEEGLARGRMLLKAEHMNIFAGIHGGILFAFADHIGGACGNSMDYKALLIESTARYKKSAREGEMIFAEARLQHTRKKVDIIDINVTNSTGDLLAVFQMKSFIIDNAAKTP